MFPKPCPIPWSILDKVEYYSIDHAPIMPTFAIPEDFGTEEGYRQKYTEKDLFDEFTQDENGKVVLDEDAANAKIKRLGGYDKLYRIKLEADYLAKLAFDGAKKLYGDPLSDEVKERLVFELYIMKTMGSPVTLDRARLHPGRPRRTGRFGRSRPWIGSWFGCCLLSGDHPHRPDQI